MIAGIQTKESYMQTDEQQIRELVSTWMRATKAGDTETVLGLMADDARFLVAGQPPFGKEAFAASPDPNAPRIEFDGQNEILEIEVVGDWAYMLSKLTVTTRRAGAKEMVRAGHTLTILVKRQGRWLLYRDANLLVPI